MFISDIFEIFRHPAQPTGMCPHELALHSSIKKS